MVERSPKVLTSETKATITIPKCCKIVSNLVNFLLSRLKCLISDGVCTVNTFFFKEADAVSLCQQKVGTII